MEERNSIGVNNKGSYWMRDEIVPETNSYGGTIRGQINLEHKFELKSTAVPGITRLLRIDFLKKHYIKEFSIFHFNPLRNELTHKGKIIEDPEVKRWICVDPPVGKYQINTIGGNYHYQVILFKSDLRLPDSVQLKINNPTLVTLRLPDTYDDFPKALSYRIDNRPTWLTTYSEYPHRKFKLEVEPSSVYELKMKLCIKEVFETEYTPSIVLTEHPKWVEGVEPDCDLLDLNLDFYFRMKSWPHKVMVNLMLKLPDSEDWLKYSKEFCRSPVCHVSFDLKKDLYDRLTKDDMAIEWRLHFQDPQIDDREVLGPIKKIVLKNRIGNNEHTNHTLEFSTKDQLYRLFWAPDGRFVLKRRFKKTFVRNGLKGEYIIEDGNNGKKRIRLVPKYGISFDISKIQQNTSVHQILLPELLHIIFEYTNGEPYKFQNRKLEQLRRLSLVCKRWFNVITEKFFSRIFDGEFVTDKDNKIRVIFNKWNTFDSAVTTSQHASYIM